jgi:hypothetical protein
MRGAEARDPQGWLALPRVTHFTMRQGEPYRSLYLCTPRTVGRL